MTVQGQAWQVGVWDRISQIYRDEITPRFEPVVDGLLRRADLRGGERVLDLGTGTGAPGALADGLTTVQLHQNVKNKPKSPCVRRCGR